MLRVYLIRHGETDYNRRRIMQGHSEQPLNDTGVRQAGSLARRLTEFPIDLIYSSDIRRAAMTAVIIAAHIDKPVIYEPLLRERNPGALTHRPYEEVMEFFTDPEFQPPEGESQAEFDARVLRAFERLVELERERAREAPAEARPAHVAVVTHGMVCSSFLRSLKRPGETPEPFAWGNASLTIADRRGGGWEIARLCDTEHLAGVAPGLSLPLAAAARMDAASSVGG